MIERQHVWLGPDATSFAEPCEACLSVRESLKARHAMVRGTLRRDADVGFTSCSRGHRIVVRRLGREELLTVAARHMNPDSMVIVVVGDAAVIREKLERFGPVKVVDEKGERKI